jgi:outer membrane protein assembly factor BamB
MSDNMESVRILKREMARYVAIVIVAIALADSVVLGGEGRAGEGSSKQPIEIRNSVGIIAVLEDADAALKHTLESNVLVYFQSADKNKIAALRKKATEKGLLGTRLFVDEVHNGGLHMAANLADLLVAPKDTKMAEAELLRVIHPGGKVVMGERTLTKKEPQGSDNWAYPNHGADNNPLSVDQNARYPYYLQVIEYPKMATFYEITVIGGGRIYKSFGDWSQHGNNEVLNKLYCMNAYNGQIIWTQKRNPEFMNYRNTMIATAEGLYIADDKSCKVLSREDGRTLNEIALKNKDGSAAVWKWMALDGDRLFALLGGKEKAAPHRRRDSSIIGPPNLGGWAPAPENGWLNLGPKKADDSLKYNYALGNRLVGSDIKTQKTIWEYSSPSPIDGRAVCFRNGRIYAFSPGDKLVCLNAADGKIVWENDKPGFVKSIHANSQVGWVAYRPRFYMQCNEDYIFFSNRKDTGMVVSTATGKHTRVAQLGGAYLVLGADALYAGVPGRTNIIEYGSWKTLGTVPGRGGCVKLTGTVDSLFTRGGPASLRVDLASRKGRYMGAVRPPCMDGVIAASGMLYWGPWMCQCAYAIRGHVGVASRAAEEMLPREQGQGKRESGTSTEVMLTSDVGAKDWPSVFGRTETPGLAANAFREAPSESWVFESPSKARPTSLVTGYGMVFLGDENGMIRALDDRSGQVVWECQTGGPVYSTPVLGKGRLFAGSADGWVYALEAKTGRRLWRYSPTLNTRKIPVFGKLISSWPISGGVVHQDGKIYGVAGIADFSDVIAFSLDASTGKPVWINRDCGMISKDVQSGASLQSEVFIRDNALCFRSPGNYGIARIDLNTGKVLNEKIDKLIEKGRDAYRTVFSAYYPRYGTDISFLCHLPGGRSLFVDMGRDSVGHNNYGFHRALALYKGLEDISPGPVSTQTIVLKERKLKSEWTYPGGRRIRGFVAGPSEVLVLSFQNNTENREVQIHTTVLESVNLKNGAKLWSKKIRGGAVKYGLAASSTGRILIALESGKIVSFR